MLSRNAENLYWMARYVERADATARLLEMGTRIAMLPGSWGREEWRSIARVTGAGGLANSPDPVGQREVLEALMLDDQNPSSIRACLERARQNGKSVRTALTRDMWEVLNEDWRRLERMDTSTVERDLPWLLDWVKQKAMMIRGSVENSMLRDDRYAFTNLGSFLERADMTLRLLDVKYYVLLPETDVVGGARDHHQWTSVLHAASAMRAYHHTYRGDYAPWKIADFLLLNARFPRSVRHCHDRLDRAFEALVNTHEPDEQCLAARAAIRTKLHEGDMDRIFQDGLHEFVQELIGDTQRLADCIARAYHF